MTRAAKTLCLAFSLLVVGYTPGCKAEPQRLFPVVKDRKWGYINQHGRIVIRPAFEEARAFSEARARVVVDSKFGFIDEKGQLQSNKLWEWNSARVEWGDVSEGLAPMSVRGDSPWPSYGYVDATGRVAIAPQFRDARRFSEGLAWVNIDGKWGCIDKSGNVVIQPKFVFESTTALMEDISFHDGLTRVKDCGKDGDDGWWCAGKWGFVDKAGEFAIKPQFDYAEDFSEGLAPVLVGDSWEYVDTTGKVAIGPQFEWAETFSEGLALVTKGGEYAYIDRTGSTVSTPKVNDARSFSDGLAVVRIGLECGYIDKTGKVAIAPRFDDGDDFKNGLAWVRIGKEYGYINKRGKYVWGPLGMAQAPLW